MTLDSLLGLHERMAADRGKWSICTEPEQLLPGFSFFSSLLRGNSSRTWCEKPKTCNSHLLDRTSVSTLLCTCLMGTAFGTGRAPPSSQTVGNPAAAAVPGAWTGSSWRSASSAPHWPGRCSVARQQPAGSLLPEVPLMVDSDVGCWLCASWFRLSCCLLCLFWELLPCPWYLRTTNSVVFHPRTLPACRSLRDGV